MSLQAQHDPKNEAEITYWNCAGGRHRVERQQSQDMVLGPILIATLDRARDFDLDIASGGGMEEALEAAMACGPARRALQDQGPETCAAAATSIRRALQPYQRCKQVALAGAISANNA
jgi:hypothetical protein